MRSVDGGVPADPARCSASAWRTSARSGCGTSPARTSRRWCGRTGESSSMAQLDGSDIVYVARVSVPKIIALRVDIGTRFPAAQTSQGKVLLAALRPSELEAVLAEPSRSGLPPYIGRSHDQLARGADPGAGPWLGAGRRGARSGRPVGRRAGPRRHGRGARRDERDGARRGDLRRRSCSRSTCRSCCARPATSAPTGRCGSRARTPRSRSTPPLREAGERHPEASLREALTSSGDHETQSAADPWHLLEPPHLVAGGARPRGSRLGRRDGRPCWSRWPVHRRGEIRRRPGRGRGRAAPGRSHARRRPFSRGDRGAGPRGREPLVRPRGTARGPTRAGRPP